MKTYQFKACFKSCSMIVSVTAANEQEAFRRVEKLCSRDPEYLAVVPLYDRK